jgi:hypothetical protein
MTATAAPMRVAEIALARNTLRVLAVPGLLVVLGLALASLGLGVVGQATGLAMAVLGAIVGMGGALLALRAMTVQLFVEVDYLHLKAIGLDRRYHLAPGQLSRLATTGPRRVKLGSALPGTPRLTSHAALPAGERIEVIRFGATPSVVLVPTEGGRVAVAARSESELVEALMVASHTRAMRPGAAPHVAAAAPTAVAATPTAVAAVPATVAATPATAATVPIPAAVAAVVALSAPSAAPAGPARPLTGIERMWMEERLVQERRAALTGARDEQAAASMSAASAALSPARVSPVPLPSQVAVVAAVAVPRAAPAPPPRIAVTTVAVPRVSRPRRRPRPQARRVVATTALSRNLLLLAAPLLGALAIWIVSVVIGPPSAGTGLDPMGAALILSGPIAVLAIWMAQSRWPRLAGLTSVAALVALLLVGRALIG